MALNQRNLGVTEPLEVGSKPPSQKIARGSVTPNFVDLELLYFFQSLWWEVVLQRAHLVSFAATLQGSIFLATMLDSAA